LAGRQHWSLSDLRLFSAGLAPGNGGVGRRAVNTGNNGITPDNAKRPYLLFIVKHSLSWAAPVSRQYRAIIAA